MSRNPRGLRKDRAKKEEFGELRPRKASQSETSERKSEKGGRETEKASFPEKEQVQALRPSTSASAQGLGSALRGWLSQPLC